MTQWGDISGAEYVEMERSFGKQHDRWRRQQLDAIDTELARRSVQKALCDGLSGHVKPEATVQSPASAARESAMMKDFDHVVDAGKVALCGMTAGVSIVGGPLVNYRSKEYDDLAKWAENVGRDAQNIGRNLGPK